MTKQTGTGFATTATMPNQHGLQSIRGGEVNVSDIIAMWHSIFAFGISVAPWNTRSKRAGQYDRRVYWTGKKLAHTHGWPAPANWIWTPIYVRHFEERTQDMDTLREVSQSRNGGG